MFTRESPRRRASSYGSRGETREGSRITIVTSYLGTTILYIMIRDNPCVTTILQASLMECGCPQLISHVLTVFTMYLGTRCTHLVLQILLVCQSNPHRLQFIKFLHYSRHYGCMRSWISYHGLLLLRFQGAHRRTNSTVESRRATATDTIFPEGLYRGGSGVHSSTSSSTSCRVDRGSA